MNHSKKNRRYFIKQAGIVSIGFVGLSRCAQSTNKKQETTAEVLPPKEPGYGPLVPDPAKYMDLPPGFSYKVISKKGTKMDDGLFVPGAHDGMGAFPLDNDRVILVRNHENSLEGDPIGGPFGENNSLFGEIDSNLLYDKGNDKTPCLGGTTTIIYNEKTGEVEKSFLSLAGTLRNCAGGVTPWGTWITCEEDINKTSDVLDKDHGFNFEVPATSQVGLTKAVPLVEMGRFNHEAVCVDPETSIVYQTEDRGDSLIYRYIPNVKEQLSKGGKLQVLAIKGQPSLDTRNWEGITMKEGDTFEVEWLDIDNVLSPEDDLRHRGYAMGAARFARGEGMWFGDGELYFACTSGGPGKFGQVFRYVPGKNEGTKQEKPGKLTLFAESDDPNLLRMCDNVTIAPWGDVILCEDNYDTAGNHIRGITMLGEKYTIAANVGSSSEFAGAVFSPSGKTLFVNVQANGDTLAITGPWV